MSSLYYLVENGATTGPHTLRVLHQKAEIRALSPDALVIDAATPGAPWRPIHEVPELHAHIFPTPAAPKLDLGTYKPSLPAADAGFSPTDVRQLLHDNTARQLAAEKLAGARPLVRIGTQRRRDFWLLLIVGNGIAAASGFFLGFNLIQTVFILSFVVFFSLSLYWVLYHVMDPY